MMRVRLVPFTGGAGESPAPGEGPRVATRKAGSVSAIPSASGFAVVAWHECVTIHLAIGLPKRNRLC
jgi:hypothetical protein